MDALRAQVRRRMEDPGRLAFDAFLLVFGLFLFALAQVFSLYCNLGASSWTVLHDGISRQTPLSIGQATQLVGLLMLGVAWKAGIPPGIGTAANMLLIGSFMDLIIWTGVVPLVDAWPLRFLMLLAGAVLLGLASALYIKAGFGAGPRDSFMLAVMRRTNLRVGRVRWMMEFSAVIAGALLGGRFGIGTLLFALIAAPSVEFFFRVFQIRAGRQPEPAPLPATD